jgi:hypothetical protein
LPIETRDDCPMEEVPLFDHNEGNHEFQEFLTRYDAPTYIRRARGVEAALDQLKELLWVFGSWRKA